MKYITDNKNEYLYGTELPDKPSNQPDGIGDPQNQHVYFNETYVLIDDASCGRAQEEYESVISYLNDGEYAGAARTAGVMSHYITLGAMYGNVMNATYWGTPVNSTAYSNYINSQTTSYTSAMFDPYLAFDGTLETNIDGHKAAQEVAYDTTFGNKNCTWMDDNYDWANSDYKDRCGASLNFAVNLLTDTLHKIYLDIPAPSQPQGLDAAHPTGNSINLTWDKNSEDNILGYSIYINETASEDTFRLFTNVSKDLDKYTVTGLIDETKYYFQIKAYNGLFKGSAFSSTVWETTLDITPPSAPKLYSQPDITSKRFINITGNAEPETTIEIYNNEVFATSSTAGEPPLGFFRIPLTLDEGENNITARSIDDAGNPSSVSKPQVVILDSLNPIANAGMDRQLKYGKQPLTAVLNGSGSYDSGAGIENFTWHFENYDHPNLYVMNPSFVIGTVGNFWISLNVTDFAKNWDVDNVWINITAKDINPPKVISRAPEPDETDVPVNTTITARFNERLDETSLSIELYNLDSSIKISSGISISYQPETRTITITMLGNLSYNTTYMVIIEAEDLEGNSLTNGTWNFTTVPPPLDSDLDGMQDSWELLYGLDPTQDDSSDDPDEDGLSNFGEYNHGINSTDPTDYDTDNDSLPDGWEVLNKLDPHDPSDIMEDPDGDGFTNLEEFLGEDGEPTGDDSTNPHDPNDYPGAAVSDVKEDELESWLIYIIVVIVLVVILVILGLVLKHINRTKEIDNEEGNKDDDYFKIRSKDELGIGGGFLTEDELGYVKDKEYKEPEDDDDEDSDLELVKCTKCGAKLDSYTDYCYECGEVLKKSKVKSKEIKAKKKQLAELKAIRPKARTKTLKAKSKKTVNKKK